MGYEQSVLRRATARLEAQRKAREEAQARLPQVQRHRLGGGQYVRLP